MSKTLYALCIGINDYQYVGKLKGCEPDANNMFNYLKKASGNAGFEFKGKKLLSAQATKAAIVDGFQNHLGQAGPDDVAVFYFSGHGAEEAADEVFKTDSPKPLSTLVCVDSRNGKVTDLADKEMRYLIHQMSYDKNGKKKKSPHLVVISDSCHSGGIGREADTEMVARLTVKSPPRKWEQFIFHKEIPKSKFENANLRTVMPQGEYINLSSAEASELAYEVRGSGVFTSTLLEVLSRTSGKITYTDLHSRIRYFIRGRFPQTPTIDVVEGEEKAKNQYFLGGAAENKGVTANVVYNPTERIWLLDMGAIKGMPPVDGNPVEIKIFKGDKQIAKAKVTKVDISTSVISFTDGADKIDRKDTYSAEVIGIFKNPTNIYFDGKGDGIKNLTKEIDKKKDFLKDNNLNLTDSFATAQYIVGEADGKYIIHHPGSQKPLVLQQEVKDEDSASEVLNYLQHIANWEFFKGLENPKTKFTPKPPVELQLVRSSDETEIKANADGVYELDKDEIFKISVTNKHRTKKLFASVWVFDPRFGINADFIDGKVDYLEVQDTLWVWGKDDIYASDLIEDYHRDYKWDIVNTTLKLVIATERFEVDSIEQEALPAPSGDAASTRALRRRSTPSDKDWMTVDFVLRVKV